MVLSYPSMFSLENRTAVITGGTRGIGAAMAIALAEAGADIILIQVGKTPRPTTLIFHADELNPFCREILPTQQQNKL